MLFLIDEAIAVPSHIFETFEHSLNKKQNNVIFAIFNPVKSTGWAIDAHTKHSYKWMTERITAYDCPRLDRQDIDDARLRLGENSAEFRVSYLGLPPLEDSDVWIPYEWITDARWRFSKEEFVPKKGEPLIFGVDFGFGGDKTVICIRHGLRVIEFLEFNSPESEKVVHFVLKHIHDYEPHFVYLEQGGNSLGATQMIKKFHSNATYVVPHVKAFNTKKYSRLKDELFGRMRDAFEAGTISIPDGDDRISTEFKTELSLLKADEDDIHGRIRIRGKRSAGFQKEIMSELKYKSPDKADAFAMTFYHTYEAQYQKNQPQALLQKQKQEQDDDKQSLRCRGKTAWMAH